MGKMIWEHVQNINCHASGSRCVSCNLKGKVEKMNNYVETNKVFEENETCFGLII